MGKGGLRSLDALDVLAALLACREIPAPRVQPAHRRGGRNALFCLAGWRQRV